MFCSINKYRFVCLFICSFVCFFILFYFVLFCFLFCAFCWFVWVFCCFFLLFSFFFLHSSQRSLILFSFLAPFNLIASKIVIKNNLIFFSFPFSCLNCTKLESFLLTSKRTPAEHSTKICYLILMFIRCIINSSFCSITANHKLCCDAILFGRRPTSSLYFTCF